MSAAATLSDADILRLHDDPIFYARVAFDIEPTEQQADLLASLAPEGAKVAARSGHGVGKSTALAMAALWFLDTHEDALVPCTAPTAHQLQDVLWRELYGLYSRMPDEMRREISFNAERIRRRGSKGAIIPRTARPENPDALQGFHADNILFIIDEASGVADAVFEVARGALSTPGARVALAGNPTQLTGYFHNAFHGARDSWTRLHFSCLDSPLVAKEYPEEMRREYGEDSDIYRIRVLGEFPRQGLLSIIPADRVELALGRALRAEDVEYAPVILGVDPAWEGSDRSVIAMRQGIFARILLCRRGLRGDELANQVIRWQDELSAVQTYIDRTGVGASCCDFMRSNGRPYVGISFAESPGDDRFVNRRAEIWWRLREWLHQDVGLERHPDLLEDLIGPEYGVKDNGKIYLESKEDMRKRGLHSPDLGDALALTFSVPFVGGRIKQNNVRETMRRQLARR